jgi:hypothetical protein
MLDISLMFAAYFVGLFFILSQYKQTVGNNYLSLFLCLLLFNILMDVGCNLYTNDPIKCLLLQHAINETFMMFAVYYITLVIVDMMGVKNHYAKILIAVILINSIIFLPRIYNNDI